MARTIIDGGTFLHLIRMSCSREILTPEIRAENQSPTGIK
jgi:hypothetical protein